MASVVPRPLQDTEPPARKARSVNEMEASRQDHRAFGLFLLLVLGAIVGAIVLMWPNAEPELPHCSVYIRDDGMVVMNDPPAKHGCQGISPEWQEKLRARVEGR